MLDFELIIGGIYRLKVPFEDIYTAVFLIRTEGGDILLDCATTELDAREIIIPALERMGAVPSIVLCSHDHGDHMGGLPYILEHYQEAKAAFFSENAAKAVPDVRLIRISDGDILSDSVRIMALPGHSCDSIGILDMKTATLLSGDCIQLGGVGRYGTGITSGTDYFASIEKIGASEVQNLVASHEYYPLGSLAMGRAALEKYLDESRAIAERIGALAEEKGIAECVRIYNEQKRPPISEGSARTLAEAKK